MSIEEKRGFDVELDCTTIEGMLRGSYEPYTERPIGEYHKAISLDDNVWKIVDNEKNLVGFIRPTNCRSCTEVKEAISEVFQWHYF